MTVPNERTSRSPSLDGPRATLPADVLRELRAASANEHVEASLLSLAVSTSDAPEPVAVLDGTTAMAISVSLVDGAPLAATPTAAEPQGLRAAVVRASSPRGRHAIVWDKDTDVLHGLRVPASFVALVADRIAAMARRLVANPNIAAGALLRPSAAEEASLLAWGRGESVPILEGSAASDVRRHASTHGESLAIVAGRESATFGALDARVDAVAAGLRTRGVDRGSRVAVALERSVDLVAVLLGLWRIGAVYVPIDLEWPKDRVGFVLSDAGCALLVHGERDVAPGSNVARWNIVTAPAPASARASDAEGLASDGAYIIYTSGSTGRPKGVEVGHRALRNTIRSKVDLLRMGRADTQVAVMSMAFDASIFELTMPLLAGGKLVLATRAELEDYAVLAATLERVQPTVLGATPPTWRGLLEVGWRPPAGLRALVGGEALPRDLAARLASFCRVVNMYGLTETGISSLYHEVRVDDVGAVPIGRAMPNVLTRVTSASGELARIGDVGELYVGGPSIAAGYRGLPELTRERFVSDPAGETTERFFRTGDRARVLANGDVAFLGRLDTQVKVRGLRIELGEIESALLDASNVAAAVADVRTIDGEPSIVAYVVPRDGAMNEADLRAQVRHRLPPHMVPSAFVSIPTVPVTVNGKVDRAALPAPAMILRASSAVVGSTDPLEAAVRAALALVLGPAVDLEQSFVDMGLDSVRRARVRHALARDGVDVSFVELFERRDVAELLDALRARGAERRAVASTSPGSDVDRAEGERLRPVTMNQKFPMLTHLSNPGTGAWNCQIACTAVGPLDLAKLERAWRLVVARHGALRLRFVWRGQAYPMQTVASDVEAPFTVVDGRSASAGYAAFLTALQGEELRTTFDVEAPPLHRMTAVRAPDGAIDLVWTYFAGLVDGWSSVIVVRDLFAHYDALASGTDPSFPAAPRYFDHLDRMAARDWTASEPFLREKLGDYRVPPPLGRPAGGSEQERATNTVAPDLQALFEALGDKPFRTRGVGAKAMDLSADESAAVAAASMRHRVSESTLLQSAWAIAVMREYGCNDILVGAVAANRPDYVAAVGKYTSLLPYRFRFDPAATVGGWLRENQRYVLEILAHEGVPGGHWVSILGLEPWQFPFESTFTYVNYVGVEESSARPSGVRITHTRQLDGGIPPAFGMVVIPGTTLHLRLEYNLDRGFDETMLARLLAAFADAVERLSAALDGDTLGATLDETLGARSVGVPLSLL